MSDDSYAKCRRRNYAVEQIETVAMSADEYEQAVDALATLIVKWAWPDQAVSQKRLGAPPPRRALRALAPREFN
jgi:hypothetical protein